MRTSTLLTTWFIQTIIPTTARPTLNNIFDTTPTLPAYDRITSQPVFQVTTPWGSPYMLFEKYKDEELALESSNNDDNNGGIDKFKRMQSKNDMQDTRPVSLYFMDEHDARSLADEMKQMKNMKDGDLRITCTTLAKALRQASHLGRGLPTGQPIKEENGNLLSMDEGGSLRHKIVPSKRELFYAARCYGRERVGFFNDNVEEDADLMLQPNNVIEGSKMGDRRKAASNTKARVAKAKQAEKEGVMESEENRIERVYGAMEGQVGLPVFYADGLVKKPPLTKRILQGSKKALATSGFTPLYFSYQDLMNDWSAMRDKSSNKSEIPESPPNVEVFNMLDVVTSIDKDQWKNERRAELQRERKGLWGKIPLVHNFVKGGSISTVNSGLERVVFVPSSLGVQAKQRVSKRGNMKARLRPMRAWGKNS
mmetsp:Transcript_190/g.240  ORF Transcript_190/g.240 Transcript_190/m.240 type:complete len:424 (-) Transcript_190:29-1300(-)|eukprot:scaffold70131_cov66-Cyclotella_meneghiniana.AAC.9